jgi:hypothetical protein
MAVPQLQHQTNWGAGLEVVTTARGRGMVLQATLSWFSDTMASLQEPTIPTKTLCLETLTDLVLSPHGMHMAGLLRSDLAIFNESLNITFDQQTKFEIMISLLFQFTFLNSDLFQNTSQLCCP